MRKHVGVVLDHVVAERGRGERARREGVGGVPQRPRDGLDARWRRRRRRRRAAVARPAARSRRGPPPTRAGEREVRVAVGARDAALDAQALVLADEAEPGGAVVVAPRDPGRRPRAVDVALVGVDGGGEQHHQLRAPSARHPPRNQRSSCEPGRARRRGRGRRRRRSAPSRHRLRCTWQLEPARSVCGLAMKRDAHALLVGGLLQALLEHGVAVGRLEHVGVADVELVLAEAPLALRALDGDARGVQVAAHGGVEVLGASALLELVVLEVPARRARGRGGRCGRRRGRRCGTGSARARWRPWPRSPGRRRRATWAAQDGARAPRS